jgi:hypothetical protein
MCFSIAEKRPKKKKKKVDIGYEPTSMGDVQKESRTMKMRNQQILLQVHPERCFLIAFLLLRRSTKVSGTVR